MSDSPEEAWLIALAAAVSDGREVDWEEAERRPTTDEQKQLVQDLRRVAAIVQGHRTAEALPDSQAPPNTEPGAATQWRHLVLFDCVGTGAFGSVYRGWDPQLDREVAVKLRPKVRQGAAPLDEARHLARIRHPNVVVVHGADEDDEMAGIWMEYIEGQTLAAIVRDRGPMSAREAAGIGLDLCSAVSAIHAAGLLHRDIKAHNVMREVGGRIVLMDFSGAHGVTADVSTTMFSGTPLYMAPELFDGSAPSPASDVYSLGVLLFFVLSGELPVAGVTMDDVRRAHAARTRRRLRDVRPDLPDGLVKVVERATAHDSAERFHTAGELEHALANASGAVVVRREVPAAGAKAPKGRLVQVWTVLGTLLTVAILGAFANWPVASMQRQQRPLTARFTVGPPYLAGSWPRVSPDGRLVVFGAIVEGRNRFWIRPLDSLDGKPLMQTTANETPFWSPDSTTLCFFADGRLMKIAVAGGSPQVLADTALLRGGDWSGDNIIFSNGDGIQRIGPTGGTVDRLTSLDASAGDYLHSWPEFLPDGRRFLFVVRSSRQERTGIFVGSLDGEAPWRLMPLSSRVAYADDRLLYVREGSLVAQPFDPGPARLTGEPTVLSERVQYHAGGDAAFDVSATGVLIYSVEAGLASTRLVLFDRRGRELRALTDVGTYGEPRFSPDGERVVAQKTERGEQNADLWVYGVSQPGATRLTRSAAPDVSPVWSPDGRQIAFSSKKGSVFDIYAKAVDAIDEERLLIAAPGDKFVEHWSRDGRYLTGTVLRSGLWLLPLVSDESPQRIRVGNTTGRWQSELSPDGRWLAYTSNESGTLEVYVEPFPATGARWQVSPGGGAEPHWRSDTDELLYIDPAGILTSVGLLGPERKPGPPQRLFAITIPDPAGPRDYTVSPDGRYLVVNTFVADPIVPPIEVVLNWPSLLGR